MVSPRINGRMVGMNRRQKDGYVRSMDMIACGLGTTAMMIITTVTQMGRGGTNVATDENQRKTHSEKHQTTNRKTP